MAPYTLNWGILATGGIAKTFSKDLLIDPKTRNVEDVVHKVVAVASSSSVPKSEDFAKDIGCDASTKCYGSYDELVADPNVDIIYIATPHSHHYEHAKQCLDGGKHVLCEKPFTINADQAKHLAEIAKAKKLFLMEAVWTRYFPLVLELQRLLFDEQILGIIRKVTSDLGLPFNLKTLDPSHRMLDPNLGGGALLDLGIYAVTWIYLTCFSDPRNEHDDPRVASDVLKAQEADVDEYANISMIFPTSRVVAMATTNMTIKSDEDSICRIQGDKGDITVQWPPFRPTQFTIYRKSPPQDVSAAAGPYAGTQQGEVRTFEIPEGHGMFWEADECARCLRDGKLESPRMPLSESISTMTVLDTVRKQNDLKYPDKIERLL